MSDGQITRNDIITDDALNWGPDYAKGMEVAIAKNKEFVAGILTMHLANEKLRKSQNQTDFIKQKNDLKLITDQTILSLKEQHVAETNLEKVKQEALRTEKLAIDVASKKQAASKAGIKLSVEERLTNEQNNRIAKEQAALNSKMTTAYTKLNLQRTIAKRNLLDLLSAENQNTEAIKSAEKEFASLDIRVRKADQAVGDFHKSVGNYPKIASFTSGIKNLVGAFGLLGGGALVASVLKKAFDTIKQFDQGIADLSAITGAAGKDLDYLKNQAIDLGKGTKGGAVAVVEAYKLIASAKPELLENVEALNQVTEAVLTLAQASGMEMPDAAIALTDAMNQFGADASQAAVFVDALANGAKYGSAEIPQVTEALLKFGAVARTSNVSIQESTALVELLAENGLKGADAGTALRNVLLKISAPDALPKKAQEEFAKLGISLETLKDKSIPIQQKLELLKPLLKDNASIVKVFGLENATAALNVLGHTDRLKELTSKMNENGTAAEQASIRTDTLTGSMDKLESAWSSFILSLNEKGNGLGGFFKGVLDFAKESVHGMTVMFTDEEKKRNDELGKIKQTGIESAIALYSKENGYNEERLNKIKKQNSDEITENTKKVNALIADNKKLSQNTVFLTGAIKNDSFAKIMDNRKKIAALNNKTTDLFGKNTGVNSLIASGKPGKTTPPPPPALTNDNADADKAAKEALDRAKRLSDSLYEVKKQQLERDIKINDEIVSNDKLSDDVRIAALELSSKKQITLTELTQQHSLDADKFVLEKDRMNANQKVLINNDAAFKIQDINKKTSEEILKINQFDEAKYQKDLEDKVSKINIAMNEELAVEFDRFAALGDLEAMAQADREKAIEDHEKRIFDIKKAFAIKTLKLQIANLEGQLATNDLLPVNEQISADKRQKIEENLSNAKVAIKENELSKNKETNQVTIQSESEKALQILDISAQLAGALSDISNSLFDAKIQKIDDEISKNNEYYDKQIELSGNDERQKDLYADERDKKNEALEKKKRKEQHKQAVFNKAMSALNVGISTSMAIISALAQVPKFDFGISAASIATAYGIVGAAQLAAVLASPLPKYKMGRLGGPAETAWVGDGFVSEVITSADGSNPRLTPNTPTLANLGQGDIVHKSVEDYNRYIRASILSGFNQDQSKLSEFQSIQFDNNNNKELVDEMRLTRKAIEKNKTNITVNVPKIDMPHEMWKAKNKNWNQ
ncbi:phage tail tape measure protein [Flavobacterium sp. Sr18]|uniref:phage tail tape measure protein n=1 Tax=Flavobacterium sp. Sr18 TaxID=935222 RepID=UPI0013E4C56C|nr:phage tail tape measure protein [Flavobacterium sp. Sr18]QIH39737.1 phage tail tape measure protein [Flavobacterium sp. Sr18]